MAINVERNEGEVFVKMEDGADSGATNSSLANAVDGICKVFIKEEFENLLDPNSGSSVSPCCASSELPMVCIKVEEFCEHEQKPSDNEEACKIDVNKVLSSFELLEKSGPKYCTESSECNREKNEEKLLLEIKSKYKRNTCRYMTDNKSDLSRHSRTHTDSKTFECDICKYETSLRGNILRHVRIHTDKTPYECEHCGYWSFQRRALRNHKWTHTDKLPYNCDHCGYGVYHKSALIRHIRTHTGDKPYKCKICDYSANRLNNLKRHVGVHKNERKKGAKQCYKCEVCEYTVLSKATLGRHRRSVHCADGEFYSCQRCSYKSGSWSELKSHNCNTERLSFNCRPTDATPSKSRRTFTKLHKCEECGYGTPFMNNLTKHMRKHTGVKQHNCQHCDYSAYHRSSLHRHMRKHSQILVC